MSVPGDRRRPLRDRVFGVAGALVAAGVLASCGVAGPGQVGPGGAGPAPASLAASGPCPQVSGLASGQPGSVVVSGVLDSVSAASAASVWAVGSTPTTDPMTMHWNGGAWAEQVLTLTPGQPGNPPGSFDAVAAVSPRDVWVVGVTAGEPLAEHWDGKTWTWPPGFCGGSSGPGCLTPPSSPSSQ